MKFNTALLHGGNVVPEKTGATLVPIYQSSAFAHNSAEELEKIFSHRLPGFNYTRTGNPSVSAFESRITTLEHGLASVAFSSGMAAITNTILNIVRTGEEIVSSSSLYGGSYYLFNHLTSLGITTKFVKNNDWDSFRSAINEKTRAIYAETIGNPSLDVTDIKTLSQIAHEYGLPLIIDNTMATPYLVTPLDCGADIVVNSSSKYINGSSNSISGVLTVSGNFEWNSEKFPEFAEHVKKFGKFAFVSKLRNGFFRDFGACMTPHVAFLNLIGLETLGLRMERACSNALKLARWFKENYPSLSVNYPGLEDCQGYEIAKDLLQNGYGAILTIRAGSKPKAYSIINNLKLALKVSNIGDTKTLVLHPASTIAVSSTPEQRLDAGVYDDLIRISVGIEDIEDLIEDFEIAIKKSQEID